VTGRPTCPGVPGARPPSVKANGPEPTAEHPWRVPVRIPVAHPWRAQARTPAACPWQVLVRSRDPGKGRRRWRGLGHVLEILASLATPWPRSRVRAPASRGPCPERPTSPRVQSPESPRHLESPRHPEGHRRPLEWESRRKQQPPRVQPGCLVRPKPPEESRRNREHPPRSRVPLERPKHLESRRKRESPAREQVPPGRPVPPSQGATPPS